MDLREKLRVDWTRRAMADAPWWACQTPDVGREEGRRLADIDLDAMLDGLDLAPDSAVLELGCGTGRLCGLLADRYIAVVGLDVSPAMLEAAKVLHPERPTLRYVQGDGVRLPFPRRSFDLVMAFAVLQHLDPTLVQAALCSVRRVLKPGGTLRVQAWLGEPQDRPPAGDTLRIRTWTEAELHDWMARAGLRVTGISPMPYPEPESHRRPVVISAEPAGLAEAPPLLPQVGERSSAAEIAQEWGLLLHLVQRATSDGALRRALHAIRAGNRLLPAQAVGWWVEARLLLTSGDRSGALKALDELDRMQKRPEDREVREAAAKLRAEIVSPPRVDEPGASAESA
jgi:SAM-dependent methyltransferase